MVNLAVFSDDAVLVSGVAFLLEQATDISLDHTSADSKELAAAVRECGSDVLLLDLSPAVNLSLIEDIRQANPECRIVLWARSVPTEFAYQAMALGIRGILRRTLPASELIRCIRKVASNDVYFEETFTSGFFCGGRVKLTRREGQIVSLLAQGLRNKEIAYMLSLSEGTVKVYLSRLFDKLGVNDRFELTLFAMHHLNAGQPAAIPAVRAEEPGASPGVLPSSLGRPLTEKPNRDGSRLAA
jgi:DNA-binding NarL/FixJ family response regulator